MANLVFFRKHKFTVNLIFGQVLTNWFYRKICQVIDGKTYKVFAFQADNNVLSSNFGSRVFFGYRELENRSNDIEIIFFSQPWAPTVILTGHTAAQEERQKLMERSNSQERKKE